MRPIKINTGNVKMIAHRGLSGLERENTCAAFLAAGNRSYFGIETDVHKTADGAYVVIHDDDTRRVTGGVVDLEVEKSPYFALKDIVLPDLDGSTHRRDLRIPLLSDYISICKRYEKVCVLELKNHFSESEIREIIEIIRGLDYLEKVIFISFDFENCCVLRRLLETNDIQWLTSSGVTDDMIRKLFQNRLNLDIRYTALTKTAIQKLHAIGILVNCWTVDDQAAAERLIKMGVDFITTNILE